MPEPSDPNHNLDAEQAETLDISEQHQSIREQRLDQKHEEALINLRFTLIHNVTNIEEEVLARDPLKYAAEHGTSNFDGNINSPDSRIFLDAIGGHLGFEPDVLTKRVRQLNAEEELLFEVGVGVKMQFAKRGVLYSHRLVVDPEIPIADRTDTLRTFIASVEVPEKEHMASLESLLERLAAGEMEVYADDIYKFNENADQLIRFIRQGTSFHIDSFGSGGPTLQRQRVVENLYRLTPHYAYDAPAGIEKSGLYYDEHGRLQKILLKTATPGVFIGLKTVEHEQSGDFTDLPMQIGYEIDIEDLYAESDYEKKRYEGVVPFIETPTAAHLLSSFDAVGLQLNLKLRAMFAEVGNIGTRYGHGFANITRELAKLVNDRQRPLSSFFEGQTEDDIRSKMTALEETGDPASRVIINILKGIVTREAEDDKILEIPVSHRRIEISDGACKDAEVYIAHGGMVQSGIGAGYLWRSSYSRPSAISTRPVIFEGVVLPAGSLFAIEDDGLVFMRLTSYSFTPEESAVVFGAQEAGNQASNPPDVLRSFLGHIP